MTNDNGKTEAAPDVEILPDGDMAADSAKKVALTHRAFPQQLPIMPLTTRPVFPGMLVPMLVGEGKIRTMLLEVAQSQSRFIGLVLAKKTEEPAAGELRDVKASDLYGIGVVAEIKQMEQSSADGPVQVLLAAMERFKVVQVLGDTPHIVASVSYLVEAETNGSDMLKAYALELIRSIKELIKLNPLQKEELSLFASRARLTEPGRLADFAAAITSAEPAELQAVLESTNVRARIQKVLLLLKKEMDISKLQVKIAKQIEEKVSHHQREFFLQEQLKAIKKELGLTKEGPQAEHERFAERIRHLTLTDEAKERVGEEMEKLKLLEPSSPEFTVTRNYLEWLTSLPWGVMSRDSYDIVKARRILDQDHYGIQDVKERILEFLSVGIVKGNMAGSILCFIGPPGVGKTSVGRSIARSIGRTFYRFSLGGMRDEAEIKGHRRTYIGALPGKFIQAIKTCKSSNPVIMLDEVDKMSASYHGDPASALLEVLDPEQNRDFLDHYLDVRFDLSNVLFICTANLSDTIPGPLIDRMEMMKLPGYIRDEKMQIARRFLLPKQLAAHGIKPGRVAVTPAAMREIIDGYAREPGVRGLENHIKKILRKTAMKIVEGKRGKLNVDARDVPKLLGKRLFTDENPFKRPRPGIATGLAWTSMGGAVLYVEASRVETDKGSLKQTGQLGSVMVESSEIAYTYVRSLLNTDKAARAFFEKNFIHLHVPAGATPKDGPSAGVTMACALYSLATNKPTKSNLAMTGELSLTGLVLPVGGIKEKTIAAKRAGIRTLILPTQNREDFEELPAHTRSGLKAHFVAEFPQIVKLCF